MFQRIRSFSSSGQPAVF